MDGVERKYRDCVRDFWRGDPSTLSEFAFRLTGSSDLYKDDGHRHASINFVTAHDGFTLNDLVSYNDKHNEANGEGNRDGESHNRSWNCGVEGETHDLEVVALREQQKRNFIATLFLASVRDAAVRRRAGTNPAWQQQPYRQDNEITWVDWADVREHWTLRSSPKPWRSCVPTTPSSVAADSSMGRPIYGSTDGLTDIQWLTPEGDDMANADWAGGMSWSMACSSTGTPSLSRIHGVPASGTTPSCCSSTRTGGHRVHHAAEEVR